MVVQRSLMMILFIHDDTEIYIRTVFIDFVQGLLNMDPIKRWSPQQAKMHPFITGERFTGHWEVSGQAKHPCPMPD